MRHKVIYLSEMSPDTPSALFQTEGQRDQFITFLESTGYDINYTVYRGENSVTLATKSAVYAKGY